MFLLASAAASILFETLECYEINFHKQFQMNEIGLKCLFAVEMG